MIIPDRQTIKLHLQDINLNIDLKTIKQVEDFLLQKVGLLSDIDYKYQIFSSAAIVSQIQRLPNITNTQFYKNTIKVQNVMSHLGELSKQQFLNTIKKQLEKIKNSSQQLKKKVQDVRFSYRFYKKYQMAFDKLYAKNELQRNGKQQFSALFWVLYLYIKNEHIQPQNIGQAKILLIIMLKSIFECFIANMNQQQLEQILLETIGGECLPHIELGQYNFYYDNLLKKLNYFYRKRFSSLNEDAALNANDRGNKGNTNNNNEVMNNSSENNAIRNNNNNSNNNNDKQQIMIDFNKLKNNYGYLLRFMDDMSNFYAKQKNQLTYCNQIDEISYLELQKNLTPQVFKKVSPANVKPISKPLSFDDDDDDEDDLDFEKDDRQKQKYGCTTNNNNNLSFSTGGNEISFMNPIIQLRSSQNQILTNKINQQKGSNKKESNQRYEKQISPACSTPTWNSKNPNLNISDSFQLMTPESQQQQQQSFFVSPSATSIKKSAHHPSQMIVQKSNNNYYNCNNNSDNDAAIQSIISSKIQNQKQIKRYLLQVTQQKVQQIKQFYQRHQSTKSFEQFKQKMQKSTQKVIKQFLPKKNNRSIEEWKLEIQTMFIYFAHSIISIYSYRRDRQQRHNDSGEDKERILQQQKHNETLQQQSESDQYESIIFYLQNSFESIYVLTFCIYYYAKQNIPAEYKKFNDIFNITLVQSFIPLQMFKKSYKSMSSISARMPSDLQKYLLDLEKKIVIIDLWEENYEGYQVLKQRLLIDDQKRQFHHHQQQQNSNFNNNNKTNNKTEHLPSASLQYCQLKQIQQKRYLYRTAWKRMQYHIHQRIKQINKRIRIQLKIQKKIINMIDYILKEKYYLLKYNNIDQIVLCCIMSSLSINQQKQKQTLKKLFEEYNSSISFSYNENRNGLRDHKIRTNDSKSQNKQQNEDMKMNIIDYYNDVFLEQVSQMITNIDSNEVDVLLTPIRINYKDSIFSGSTNKTTNTKPMFGIHNIKEGKVSFGGQKFKQGRKNSYAQELFMKKQSQMKEENEENSNSEDLPSPSFGGALHKTFSFGQKPNNSNNNNNNNNNSSK